VAVGIVAAAMGPAAGGDAEAEGGLWRMSRNEWINAAADPDARFCSPRGSALSLASLLNAGEPWRAVGLVLAPALADVG